MLPSLTWQCLRFDQLSGKQLYAILQARCAVFTVEQNCPYQDMDNHDFTSLHVIAWAGENQLAAYLRITAPQTVYAEPSLGRVLCTSAFRRQGIGRRLMLEGIKFLNARYPAHAIRLHAQTYLEVFYSSLGFERLSEEHLEHGIPHIEMIKPLSSETVTLVKITPE